MITTTVGAQLNNKKAIFQKLKGEWLATDAETVGVDSIVALKWIYAPALHNNGLMFEAWRNVKNVGWQQYAQAILVFDEPSGVFFSTGINSNGRGTRLVGEIPSDNTLLMKYYGLAPDAPLNRETMMEILPDRIEFTTTTYQNGVRKEYPKYIFYKN